MPRTQIRGSTQIQPETIFNQQIALTAAIATSKLADGAEFLKRNGSVELTGNLVADGWQITGLSSPVNDNDAATKIYVDSIASGVDPKASVRAATTANIVLSGTQTIDGVALSAGNRVLVKNQTTASQNGIYVVAAGAWTRSPDADSNTEVTPGMFTFVEEGTVNADSGWVLSTTGAVTLGTTSLSFVQFSGAGQVVAGTGLSKSGNTLSIDNTVVTLAGTQTLTNKSIDASQLTGTIAAARMPAFTGGDVTSSAGSAVLTIGTAAVTYAKIQNVSAASRLLGRGSTSGAGSINEIALGTNLVMTSTTLDVGSNVTVLGNTTTGTGSIVRAGTPNITNLGVVQSANGQSALSGVRFTDTAPTGNFIDFRNASASTALFTVDVTGSVVTGIVPTARLSGTLAAGQFPALTGAITTAAGSLATSLGNNVVALGHLAQLPSNTLLGNSTGGTANVAGVTLSQTAAVLTVAYRNSQANLLANNFIANATTIATAAGTTTLTVSSGQLQQFTGSSTQTVVLPNATTLTAGHSFTIANRSSGIVTVNANGGGLLKAMVAGSQATFTVINVSTSAGVWDVAYSISNASETNGTVTSVSGVNTNGFTVGVATATTTPAITVGTSLSGMLKGNGTGLVAATAGSDYLVPANFVFNEIPAGLINGVNTVFTFAYTPMINTEQVYINGQLQFPGASEDYTISGATVTMAGAPETGAKVRVNYMKADSTGSSQ